MYVIYLYVCVYIYIYTYISMAYLNRTDYVDPNALLWFSEKAS